MRKIILSMMVSLDGFIEGSEKEIDWHNWNTEMDDYMSNFFKEIDTIILGKTTYELMANYWPTSSAEAENPLIAHKMNKLPKWVFSSTLTTADWRNSVIFKKLDDIELNKLKQEPGSNIVIFGGADVANSFRAHNLIDEYQIIINPVLLGKGKALFANQIEKKQRLELVKSLTMRNGNVILYYKNQNKHERNK